MAGGHDEKAPIQGKTKGVDGNKRKAKGRGGTGNKKQSERKKRQ